MPRLSVTTFRAEDYVAALAAGKVTVAHPLAAGHLYADHGPAFTGWIDGEIAACLGIVIPWQGHGDCWAAWTPLGLRHAGLLHRRVIRYLRRLIQEHRLRRLQADVMASFAAGRNWVEHLGFQLEGFMPAYGPKGEMFARYAWLNPERVDGVVADDGHFVHAISGGADAGIIRTLRPGDAAEVDSLYLACHPRWPAKPDGFWWAHPTLVLELPEDGIVGSTSFVVCPAPSPELLTLFRAEHAEVGWGYGVYVDPLYQRHGFGGRLADARHAALKALGVKFFLGMTQPSNKAMMAIFKRQQLTRGATVPNHYPDGSAGVMYHGGIV